jgi:hypothetical protein
MPKAASFCNDVLALILNGTAIANIAQNNGTSPDTSFYFSLHTANPGTNDSQLTSEISYTGYARVAVPRTTSGFGAPSGGVAALASDKDFPVSGGGTGGTVTHVGLGRLATTAGKMLYSGVASPNITVANGTIPRINGTTTTVAET